MKRVVTVFGGSGFIGRHLVRRLAATGSEVRIAVRDTEAAMFLKVAGAPGQIALWATDVTDAEQVATAVAGADIVINLIGILYESGRNSFEAIHTEAAGNIAQAARAAGASRLIHVSALSADAEAAAVYARTKAAGEEAVLSAFGGATIIRPSVVFGPDDNFFNMFAGYTRLSPVLPVFGCPLIPTMSVKGEDGNLSLDVNLYGDGGTRFQPVYVGDVADAIMAVLDDSAAQSKTYELGGPQVYSFKQIMDLVLTHTGRHRFLAPMPFGLTKFYAFFLQMLPKPLLTCDQVELLKVDNVVASNSLGFKDLGIAPVTAESILPTYLHRFRTPTGRSAMANGH